MTAYELLTKHIEDIQEILKEHGESLNRPMEGDHPKAFRQCIPSCSYRQKMKETLLETIHVLEDSRKAFKSKQLETLRKKLIQVLAETA